MELTFVLVLKCTVTLASGVSIQQMPESWHGGGECGACRHGIDKDKQVIIWVAELVTQRLAMPAFFGFEYRIYQKAKNWGHCKKEASFNYRFNYRFFTRKSIARKKTCNKADH
jgi:hypothetical protein